MIHAGLHRAGIARTLTFAKVHNVHATRVCKALYPSSISGRRLRQTPCSRGVSVVGERPGYPGVTRKSRGIAWRRVANACSRAFRRPWSTNTACSRPCRWQRRPRRPSPMFVSRRFRFALWNPSLSIRRGGFASVAQAALSLLIGQLVRRASTWSSAGLPPAAQGWAARWQLRQMVWITSRHRLCRYAGRDCWLGR